MRLNRGLKIVAVLISLMLVTSSVALYSFADVEKGINEEGELSESDERGIIKLIPPPFIGVAGAREPLEAGGNAFPADEAGIAAYVNVGQSLTLEQLEDLASIFKDIEAAQNYAIGTLEILNFPSIGQYPWFYPHIYADMDGWIVAYYTKNESASMIMQWPDTDFLNPVITEINSTTLEDAINLSCSQLGIDYEVIKPNIKYYDFEFPEANSMALFVKTQAPSGSGYVRVSVPDTDILYEASYFLYCYDASSTYGGDTYLKLDGSNVDDLVLSHKP